MKELIKELKWWEMGRNLNENDRDSLQNIINKMNKQLTLTDVVSCVCKIPEPRLKVSENGTHAYCNNCAKTYWQK